MDTAVEVRYAGVVVGRGALVKDLGPDAAFVGLPEPLPVGTLVTLKIGDVVREARVDDVVESAEPSAAGMRVRWGGAATAKATAGPSAAPEAPTVPAQVAAAPATFHEAPAASVAPAEVPAARHEAPAASVAPAVVSAGESGPTPTAASADDGSGAISAPLSLASPAGEAQPGGGKKRRKRR